MASEGTAPQKGPGIIRHKTVVIQPPAWYYLEFENGKKTSIHAITFSIGRDGSNDLVYDDQRISSNHCMLTRDASGAPPVLKDTSRNGILVDGRKVPKGAEVQLNWGQRVELINFELVEDIRDTSMCFVVHNKTSGRIAELEKDVKDKEEALQSSQDEVKGLQQDVKNKEASAAKLTGELQSSQDGVVGLIKVQGEQEERIKSLQQEMKNKEECIKGLQQDVKDKEASAAKLTGELQSSQDEVKGLIKVQGEQEERIKSLQQEMKNKEECIKGLQHDNQDKTESAAPAAAGTSDQSGVSTADEKATGDKKEINQTTVTSLTMVLNDGFVGRVIGAGGSVLKGVIASTHCVIIVSQPDSFHPIVSQGRTISIKGKPKNIADAVEAIYKAAGEEDSKKVDRQRFTLESDGADFVVPKCTVKKMIGKEGQTIKKTRQETGVELQFRGPKETAEQILHCTFEESTSKGGLRSIIETLLIASEPDAGAKRLYERARSESREGEGEDEDGDDGSDDRGGSSSKRPRKRARSEGDGSKDGDAGGDSGDEDRGGGGGRGAGGGGGGRGAGAGGRGAGGGGGGRGAGGGGGGRGAGGRGGGGGGGGGGGRGGGRGGGGRGAGGGGGRGGGSKDGRSGHGKSVKASRRGDRHAKNKTGKVQHAKKAKTVASTKKARKQQKKDDRKQKGNGGNKGGRVTGRR